MILGDPGVLLSDQEFPRVSDSVGFLLPENTVWTYQLRPPDYQWGRMIPTPQGNREKNRNEEDFFGIAIRRSLVSKVFELHQNGHHLMKRIFDVILL